MWNKQGLPQCTAKAIKWSLWRRPSRLWWLCAGHESAFCIQSLFSFLFFFFSSITTSLIYLSACLSTPLLLFYLFPRIHQSAFSICVPIYLSVGLLSAILSSDRSVYRLLYLLRSPLEHPSIHPSIHPCPSSHPSFQPASSLCLGLLLWITTIKDWPILERTPIFIISYQGVL